MLRAGFKAINKNLDPGFHRGDDQETILSGLPHPGEEGQVQKDYFGVQAAPYFLYHGPGSTLSGGANLPAAISMAK